MNEILVLKMHEIMPTHRDVRKARTQHVYQSGNPGALQPRPPSSKMRSMRTEVSLLLCPP